MAKQKLLATDEPPKKTLARLRIIMERPFEEFNERALAGFMNDLAGITGCPQEEIRVLSVSSGCVNLLAVLEEIAVRRFIDLFGRKDVADNKEASALKAFADRHDVTGANAEYDATLQIVSKSPGDRHIVLVHGWRGDPDSFGRLPALLAKTFMCPASTYEYPTGFWKHSPSVVYVSRNLDNWIRNKVEAKRVAFVAHSYGGLVLRKFLILQRDYAKPLDALVRQLVFLASPLDGAALATLGTQIPTLDSAQLNELSPDSPVLYELNEGWQRWVSSHVPINCRIKSLFGTADKFVSAVSARGLDPEAVPILGRGHSEIANITSDQDEVFETVRRVLHESDFMGNA